MGYDNIAKLIALEHSVEAPLPLFEPTELFERWRSTGSSASAFPLARLFAAVTESQGIPTAIRSAFELTGDSSIDITYGHSTADHVVCQMQLGPARYIVDPAFVHHEPALLSPNKVDAVGPAYSSIQVYAGAAGDILTVDRGVTADPKRYLLGPAIDAAEQRRAYELVGRLPRNCALYIRHSNQSRQLAYANGQLVRRTGFGTTVTPAPYPTEFEFIDWFGLDSAIAADAAHLAMLQSDAREHLGSAFNASTTSPILI
jgi:hypothetical protein